MKSFTQHLSIWLLIALSFAISGCAVRSPVGGAIYTDVHSGVAATSNQAGKPCRRVLCDLDPGAVATGDASIETARRRNGHHHDLVGRRA